MMTEITGPCPFLDICPIPRKIENRTWETTREHREAVMRRCHYRHRSCGRFWKYLRASGKEEEYLKSIGYGEPPKPLEAEIYELTRRPRSSLEIAEELGVNPLKIAETLRNMERLGLVERRVTPSGILWKAVKAGGGK